MKNQFLIIVLFALLLQFTACNSQDDSISSIANLEQMMIDSSQSKNRNSIAIELAEAYQQYAKEQPDADDVPDKLMKAAQNYGTTGDFDKATAIIKSLITSYPKTEIAKDAMFQIAYLYVEMAKYDATRSETYNNNAKEHYEMLIKEFPNDPLAEQSKLLMKYIGKSDEELLEEVIKKNKK